MDATTLAIVAGAFTGALFSKLGQMGVLNRQDGKDVLEDALLVLETNQHFAGVGEESIAQARVVFEAMIKEINRP